MAVELSTRSEDGLYCLIATFVTVNRCGSISCFVLALALTTGKRLALVKDFIFNGHAWPM